MAGGSSGPGQGSGSSEGTKPLQRLGPSSHAQRCREEVKHCRKMGEYKITTPCPPRNNACLSFLARPACDALPLSRQKGRRGAGAALGSASREEAGNAEPRASPALIAGAGRGPALRLGSAQQLNQQIISSGQSRGISIPLLSSRPARLNPFIRVSPKPQNFGVSRGEMLPWGWRCWGVPKVPWPVSPRRSGVLAAVAARDLAHGSGRAVSPVAGGSFVHLRAAR